MQHTHLERTVPTPISRIHCATVFSCGGVCSSLTSTTTGTPQTIAARQLSMYCTHGPTDNYNISNLSPPCALRSIAFNICTHEPSEITPGPGLPMRTSARRM